MTIQASGQDLYLGNIAQEYGVGLADAYLGAFYRGSPSGYVKANGSGNSGVNGSATVPASATNLNIGHYFGQAAGYTYTHTGSRVTAGDHIWMHTYFGVDWNGNTWAKTFVNNGGLFSNSVNYYPFVIYQGAGIITFINNGDVQAAGGVGAVYGSSYATSGQHCLVITASNAKPRVINNYYLAGGGGGGGWGGAGGGGGQGYYVYTAQEGPTFDGNNYRQVFQPTYQTTTHNGGTYNNPGWCYFYWGGNISGNLGAINVSAWASGGITYYRGAYRGGYSTSGSQYEIYRQYAANAYTGGGGGGIGGNGGRGIGYNTPNTGGTGGAGGGAPGTNAGWGGTGGTGGTGGSWGQYGNTGNTGGTGGGGNYTGGAGGAGGSGGGGNGAAIYADCDWSLVVGGTLYGSYVGVAPT